MSEFIVPMGNLPTVASIGQTQGTIGAKQGGEEASAFEDILQSALADMTGAGETAQSTMMDLALGGSDDLHSGAIASIKNTTAISFTSNMVSSAIRAYNDLMKMQI